MRVKIEGTLTNLTNKTKEVINTSAIYQKNSLTFYQNGIKNKLKLTKEEAILIRENDIFKNNISFSLNKPTENEYILKEYNNFFLININTLFLQQTENRIEIKYEVLDSGEIFEYIIEIR